MNNEIASCDRLKRAVRIGMVLATSLGSELPTKVTSATIQGSL